MRFSRREFASLAGASAVECAFPGSFAARAARAAVTRGKPNSVINGVRIGVQPFCYHDLANNPENRPLLIDAMLQNGLSIVELHAAWVEPQFSRMYSDPALGRAKQREWRLSTPPSFYEKVKKEFDNAGIEIFTYYVNFTMSTPADEIDKVCEAARLLGAKGAVGSYGQAVAARLVPFPAKHKIFVGLHNHDDLSDPDAFSNEVELREGPGLIPGLQGYARCAALYCR